MSWFRVDDKACLHRKLVRAGNAACGAWVRMGSWTSGQSPRGFVPKQVADLFATATELRKLLETGLLEKVAGGFALHDFEDWNPSEEELLRKKAANAARQARFRNASRNALLTPESAATIPSHPIPNPEELSSESSGSRARPRPDPGLLTPAPDKLDVPDELAAKLRMAGCPDPRTLVPKFLAHAKAHGWTRADWLSALEKWTLDERARIAKIGIRNSQRQLAQPKVADNELLWEHESDEFDAEGNLWRTRYRGDTVIERTRAEL